MVAASGEQFEISAGGYRAVVTECGAGLRLLECDGVPLVSGFGEDEPATGGRGQLLMPWPNRVADGRYRVGDRVLQLPLTEVTRGHANHGLVRWVAWTAAARGAGSVTLRYRLMGQSGYPWTLDLAATYALGPDGLTVTVSATNLSGAPAPFAAGAHPYLRAGPGPVDDWELTVPTGTALRVDGRKIPVARVPVAGTELDLRAGRRLGAAVLDTAFTDLARDADGRATVTVRGPDGTVRLWMDEHHRWVQVYSGDELSPLAREALAVEPMTAPPDAFNSGTDLWLIEPGATRTCRWGVQAGGQT